MVWNGIEAKDRPKIMYEERIEKKDLRSQQPNWKVGYS